MTALTWAATILATLTYLAGAAATTAGILWADTRDGRPPSATQILLGLAWPALLLTVTAGAVAAAWPRRAWTSAAAITLVALTIAIPIWRHL